MLIPTGKVRPVSIERAQGSAKSVLTLHRLALGPHRSGPAEKLSGLGAASSAAASPYALARATRRRSRQCLERAIERHQPGLGLEMGVALGERLAEFGEDHAVRPGLGLGCRDARRPIGELDRAA